MGSDVDFDSQSDYESDPEYKKLIERSVGICACTHTHTHVHTHTHAVLIAVSSDLN